MTQLVAPLPRVRVMGLLGLMVSCSGSEFRVTGSCPDDGCAGEPDASGSDAIASGGSSTSEAGVAGSGGRGAGGANLQDSGISSGGGTSVVEAGVSEAGVVPLEFPSTPILDGFESWNENGVWSGATVDFHVDDGVLHCDTCVTAVYWHERFGANQEAYVTVMDFSPEATEVNVVLKGQGNACDQIEILYDPLERRARFDYCYGGAWKSRGGVTVELQAGNLFGGRAHEDGTVEMFVNGAVVDSVTLDDFPFEDGFIGLSGIPADGVGIYFDDFGGGDF